MRTVNILFFASLIPLHLCIAGCVEYRALYNPELSFIHIQGIKQTTRGEKIIWEIDDSAKPAIISVRLGAKEMIEVRELGPNIDLALKEYLRSELDRRRLCNGGFEIRPGQRTGSKIGDYGFGLQCFWKPEQNIREIS